MVGTASETDTRRQVSAEEARDVAEQARESWDKPSFAKEVFLGRFPLELVHPFPRPAADDVARTDEYLQTLRAVCERMDGQRIEADARVPDEYLRMLADAGAFGLKIDRAHGGMGLSQVAYNRVLTMVASVHPSLGALLSAHQSIGVPEPLKLAGTEEQKAEFLPRCARGEVSAFLLTEPDVGSDPARLASTATPVDDGAAYELDGVKLWTTNGVIADLLVVMARVPAWEDSSGGRHKGGVSAFVVEAASEGITVERRNRFMGLRGIENGVTRLHRVRVPRGNRIGREGDGLKIALTTLNAGRLAIPAMAAGSGKWSLKIAREWSRERVQWGKPVGEHEAVATMLSHIAATTYALEAVVELAGQMADEGRNDIRIEAALGKLWSSERACELADMLLQIRGGRGYETAASLQDRGERAVPVEQMVRDLRINRIFEGSSEIMRLLIAREAVDAHLTAAGALADPKSDLQDKAKAAAGASGFYARWLPTLMAGMGDVPVGYSEFGDLAAHLRFIERSARKLARNTFYGMARWQAAMENRQAFLGRVVDIGAELFAMSASCVRAEAQRRDDPVQGESAYELADAFCRQATGRVESLMHALWHNTDGADREIARKVLDDRYTWLESGILDQSEGTGPWIADWRPGPSTEEDVARRSARG